MLDSIDNKIISLIKAKDKEDPIDYIKEITKEYRVEKLNEDIINCKKCNLCNNKYKSIYTGSIEKGVILVVSESVESSINSNETIVGPYSYNEQEVINQISEIFNVNKNIFFGCKSVNCKPNYTSPSVEERYMCCNNHLYKIIDIVNPSVIIALGAVAANGLNDYLEDPNDNFRVKYNTSNHRNKICNFRGYKLIITHSIEKIRQLERLENKDDEIINNMKNELFLDFQKALLIAKENRPDIIPNLNNI